MCKNLFKGLMSLFDQPEVTPPAQAAPPPVAGGAEVKNTVSDTINPDPFGTGKVRLGKPKKRSNEGVPGLGL